MGAPASSILFEFYIQYLEHIFITLILDKYKILGYFRYVDDIIVIYNEESTNISDMLSELNTMSPKRKFTSKLEENGNISFLDITITKLKNTNTAIYRKPTTTDCIIPCDSCHPMKHKVSGIRYLLNRML